MAVTLTTISMKYLFLALLLLGAMPALSNSRVSGYAAPEAAVQTLQLHTINDSASFAYQKAHDTGTLKDFPRLHPLVVHFPIVLLILAFLVQIVSFFVYPKELSWVTLFLIVFGFIGAYVATHILHGGDPDLAALSPIARENFEMHEQFAHYTVWISAAAAAVKILSHFVFRRKLWTEIIAALLMAASVYTVVITGDMGGRLVHIDAIGVQGNKIPLHDTD